MALRGGPLTRGRLLRGGALLGPSGKSSGGTWTQVFAWDTTSLSDNNVWTGYTLVSIIPLSDFSATGGTRIRLTFNGASTEGFIANAMYVGNGGGTDPYDFGDTPVQMKMGGGNTITVGAGATGVVTDDVAFVKDGTNTFVMAMQFSDSAADNIRINANTQDSSLYYKAEAGAATQDKSVYNTYLASDIIAKIELLI